MLLNNFFKTPLREQETGEGGGNGGENPVDYKAIVESMGEIPEGLSADNFYDFVANSDVGQARRNAEITTAKEAQRVESFNNFKSSFGIEDESITDIDSIKAHYTTGLTAKMSGSEKEKQTTIDELSLREVESQKTILEYKTNAENFDADKTNAVNEAVKNERLNTSIISVFSSENTTDTLNVDPKMYAEAFKSKYISEKSLEIKTSATDGKEYLYYTKAIDGKVKGEPLKDDKGQNVSVQTQIKKFMFDYKLIKTSDNHVQGGLDKKPDSKKEKGVIQMPSVYSQN